jgi:hemerythrin superfamily protein
MRSVADQSTAELGGRFSVLTRQKNDHVTLDRLLERLDATPPDEQDTVLLDIYRLVFPHAFAEESVLWPVMRRTLPDGEELTLQIEREHQEVNELVTRLEHLDASSADRGPVLDRLVEVLREDVRDEEDELFPRLQSRVPVAQLRLLGLAWEVVRRVAPTRAHPIVARRPPGNVVAALPLSVLDRARDRLDLLIHRGAGQLDPSFRATSAALTRAAHAVEHLPIMQRGEDPSTRIAPPSGASRGTAALVLLAVCVAAFVLTRRRV